MHGGNRERKESGEYLCDCVCKFYKRGQSSLRLIFYKNKRRTGETNRNLFHKNILDSCVILQPSFRFCDFNYD